MNWEEYPLAIKEEILADPNSHDDLIDSLRESEIDLGGFETDSIPGYFLIEQLHPGQSLNPVFLAISNPKDTSDQNRITVCIKIAISGDLPMNAHDLQLQDCAVAITQESCALKELANVPELKGRIPRYVHDGEITLGRIQYKFLVTEYFFGVRQARQEDLRSLAHVRSLMNLVGCIHQHGFVHGDLTLENMLVSRTRNRTTDSQHNDGAWKIIDFGSAVSLPRWQILSEPKRPVFAHRLAGALDEIRYACPISASYDVACLALLIQESTALQFSDTEQIPNKELLSAFWEKATDPRPEFRPASAHAFLRGLDRLSRGMTRKTRFTLGPWLRAVLRRRPKTFALAASMTAAIAFAGTYAFYQRQLNQQARALNNELSQTVDSLMQRNSSMVRKITELVVVERIGIRQGKAQIDAVIDETLATWRNTRISPTVRIKALRLLVNVSDSLLEFQESDASYDCLMRTLEAIEVTSEETIHKNPLVKLLEIRVKSRLVRLAVEYQHPLPSSDSASNVAKELVEEFLRIDTGRSKLSGGEQSMDSSSELFQREVLLCAENVLRSAVYLFKGADWPLENPKPTQLVYEHALKNVDSTQQSLAIPLAALECQFGFMIHKGFLNTDWELVSPYRPLVIKVQKMYLSARARIQRIAENSLNDEESELLRELRSRIPNNLGMSYSQAMEFARAREVLQEAWVIRKQELDQAPRSLVWLKRTASTVWNLADTYLSEIQTTEGIEDARRIKLYRDSIPYRYEAIELCRRWVELDSCKESTTGYSVNVLRGFYSELELGNVERSVALLQQAEKLIGLRDPGPFHGFGEDLFLAVALLHTLNPTDTNYRVLYEKELTTFRGWLMNQQNPVGKELHPIIRIRITGALRLMQMEAFSGLTSDLRWQEIQELAAQILR